MLKCSHHRHYRQGHGHRQPASRLPLQGIGADDVQFPKPAPETYLRAAELIGVDPKRCHAFEDTELGMQSARNAGMEVVDINVLLA